MAEILTNEIKQDEPISVQEPSLQGYGEKPYLDYSGSPGAAAVGNNLIYASTTEVTVVSTTQGTLASFKLPAGTLVNNNVFRISMVFSKGNWDTVGSPYVDLFIDAGVQTFFPWVIKPEGLAGADVGGNIEFIMQALGNSKQQRYNGSAFFSQPGTNSAALKQNMVVAATNYSTGAEDGLIDHTVTIRMNWPNANATNTITLAYIVAEVLRG